MPFQLDDNILVNYDYNCQEETVVIPEGVEVIGRSAFYVCSKVRQIIIPPTVKEIRSCAFKESGIESIIIPDCVSDLGQEAFEDCQRLKSVILGNGISRIESYTFRRCQSLEHLELPEMLEKAGYDAFEECYTLKTAWVNGAEYRIRDLKAPKAVKLVYESLEATRRRFRAYAESGAMDEFEYTDYCIAGDGYTY